VSDGDHRASSLVSCAALRGVPARLAASAAGRHAIAAGDSVRLGRRKAAVTGRPAQSRRLRQDRFWMIRATVPDTAQHANAA
jgi:hypothetical protein